MNKHLLHTLLAAGVLLCGSSASAADEWPLARHAQTLAVLASDMDEAFCEDLREMRRHHPASRAELRFREALCQLSDISSQFRRAIIKGSPACDLQRGFVAMQQAYECVEECSDGVKVCSEICGMMRRFGQTMDCVEDAGFGVTSQRGRDHHHHHGHLEGTNIDGIQFRVPLPQCQPFVFRQPMR